MLILFLHKFLRENDSEKNRFALDIDFNSATEYANYNLYASETNVRFLR